MIAKSKPTTTPTTAKRLTPAAAYVRMSSGRQDKSPEEQRHELTKLAVREGLEIVETFSDQGISGDTSGDDRPGLADLVRGAVAGRFKVVLAWHTNRLTREDPFDAVVFYNQLRKAGARVVTCCEGTIDLTDFASQLLLFINQKGSSDFLKEHSQKLLRGKLAAAKRGTWNGAPAPFGMDRGLFGLDGKLLRRLGPGQRPDDPKHQVVRLVPSDDQDKLQAVAYAFQRFATADLSLSALAREMNAKGFPSPEGQGWGHNNMADLLRRPSYCGTSRWGATATGVYYQAHGEDIQAVQNGNGPGRARKATEDAVDVAEAHEGIIDPVLFHRVQAKLLRSPKRSGGRCKPDVHPLSGLLVCEHCGKPMHGFTKRGQDRHGNLAYRYQGYQCATYHKYGLDPIKNPTCGYQVVDGKAVLAWLVDALRPVLLGPGREQLVEAFKRKLQGRAKSKGNDTPRLEKRVEALDNEVGRLVQAVRLAGDIPELVEELTRVRRERDQVKAELQTAGRYSGAGNIDAESQRLADKVWQLSEAIGNADPAVAREAIRMTISRIECKWERTTTAKGYERCKLVEGDIFVPKDSPLLVCTPAGCTF
jgi:DNA invertase Pin-like site-specific DNA recombinase